MRARKRFGQHFLEAAWARKVVDAIAPSDADTFLEIGPGRGALTRPLASRAGRVVAVELDRDLAAELEAEHLGGLTVVQGDFLQADVDTLGLPADTRVAGNLPYNVSSPILIRLLELSATPHRFRDATVMLQKEVADRVLAGPGGRDYGPLAIFVAVAAKPSRLLTLPPGAFRPMPEVTSAVVRLDFSAAPPVSPALHLRPAGARHLHHAAEDAGERPGAGRGQPQSAARGCSRFGGCGRAAASGDAGGRRAGAVGGGAPRGELKFGRPIPGAARTEVRPCDENSGQMLSVL